MHNCSSRRTTGRSFGFGTVSNVWKSRPSFENTIHLHARRPVLDLRGQERVPCTHRSPALSRPPSPRCGTRRRRTIPFASHTSIASAYRTEEERHLEGRRRACSVRHNIALNNQGTALRAVITPPIWLTAFAMNEPRSTVRHRGAFQNTAKPPNTHHHGPSWSESAGPLCCPSWQLAGLVDSHPSFFPEQRGTWPALR